MGRLKEAALRFVERARSWASGDRRGRWVVVERWPPRSLFKDSPTVARATSRRARRFSSLSRARAHAHACDGVVRRWHRRPPGGGTWQWVSHWQQALEMAPLDLYSQIEALDPSFWVLRGTSADEETRRARHEAPSEGTP